ncbi:hypothetical protein GB937_010558 [Aspergillus fischeri]|nr:hypothetical protein GB937_010558 [Aspergillus fischeri]
MAEAPPTAPSNRPSTRPLTRKPASRSKARNAASRSKSTRRWGQMNTRRASPRVTANESDWPARPAGSPGPHGRRCRWQHPEGASRLLDHEGMAAIVMETPAVQRRRSRSRPNANPELDLVKPGINPHSDALSAMTLSRVGKKSRHSSQREAESDRRVSAEVDQFVDAKDFDTAEQGSSEGTEL